MSVLASIFIFRYHYLAWLTIKKSLTDLHTDTSSRYNYRLDSQQRWAPITSLSLPDRLCHVVVDARCGVVIPLRHYDEEDQQCRHDFVKADTISSRNASGRCWPPLAVRRQEASSAFGKERRRRRRRRDAYDQSAMLLGIYLDRSSLMSISLYLFLGLVLHRRRCRRRRLRSVRPPLLRSFARSLARFRRLGRREKGQRRF